MNGRILVAALGGLVLLSACKSNLEAYTSAYQKLKEREESQLNARARTTMSVNVSTDSKDSTVLVRSEAFDLILGKPEELSDYSLVAQSFINRTNAKSYFDRMRSSGYPTLLIQNSDQLYRILIGSFATMEAAEAKKQTLLNAFPNLFVLKRVAAKQP
jgi:hypothetical protein